MTTFQALSQGLRKVSQNKRLVFYVWFVNFTLAALVALPLLNQLDSYIAPTVNEEQLLQKWDDNWFQSYRMDFEKSEVARTFNYSIFGCGPFVTNLDGVLNGAGIRAISGFVVGLVTKLEFSPSALGTLTLLLLLYTLVSTFFAGGFISAYARESSTTLKEFLTKGAVYFGRFFRLFLLSLILYFLFFTFIIGGINQAIPSWTANSPSEMTPFILYMIRNVLFFFLVGLFVMWFDYAKIRIVVDDRWSALGTFGTGVKFTFRNFWKTFPLVLVLTVIGIVLMAMYAVLESLVPQTGYWTILVVFILEQLYIFFRIWIKASFYGSQTVLFRGLSSEQHAENLEAAAPTAA